MDAKTDLKEIWVCPSCGADMKLSTEESTSFYICPQCGCAISAEEQNYDMENICPNCNQGIDKTAA